MKVRPTLTLLLLALTMTSAGCRNSHHTAPHTSVSDELPMDENHIVDLLKANDLRLIGGEHIGSIVHRLDFARGQEHFSAKWKPVGPAGSEEQDGYDGNNSPRCEVAAWRLNRLLFGQRTTKRHVVAPVVVRAFHRDIECDRACARVPKLAGLNAPATFPDINDHLVLGTVTWWLDSVEHVAKFRGDFWNPRRFSRDDGYRRAFSDLVLFLFLIGHGDANYDSNFLTRLPQRDRIYSIDNGRAFDGVSFYTDQADPDWAPFAKLDAAHLVATAFSKTTLDHIGKITLPQLQRELRVVAAINMDDGQTWPFPASAASPVRALAEQPLAAAKHFRRLGRGVYVGELAGATWVLFGIGEQGITDTHNRGQTLLKRLSADLPPLF